MELNVCCVCVVYATARYVVSSRTVRVGRKRKRKGARTQKAIYNVYIKTAQQQLSICYAFAGSCCKKPKRRSTHSIHTWTIVVAVTKLATHNHVTSCMRV